MSDVAASLIVAPRSYNDIAAWMRRVANPRDRPLPLLYIHGPVGAGKSVAVAQAARAARVAITELGSDSTEIVEHATNTQAQPREKAALRTPVSWQRWSTIVQTRQLQPRILLLDDAEVVLRAEERDPNEDGAGSDDDDVADDEKQKKTRSQADTLLLLASHQMPVVVCVAEPYGVASLQTLKEQRTKLAAETKMLYVYLPRLTPDELTPALAREFPLLLHRHVRDALAEYDGDVRRARHALQLQSMGVPTDADIDAALATSTHLDTLNGRSLHVSFATYPRLDVSAFDAMHGPKAAQHALRGVGR